MLLILESSYDLNKNIQKVIKVIQKYNKYRNKTFSFVRSTYQIILILFNFAQFVK